jgi:hypothetical protein
LNTIYGWLVGFSCIIILALVSPAVGVGDSQFFVGTGMATGVGFMQNRMLHVSLGWNWNWMWTTIVGMTLSFVIFDFGPSILEMIPPFNLQMSIAVGGLFVGILQYGFLGTRSINGLPH